MNPTNGKIIIKCDINQKDTKVIGGMVVSTALKWQTNYRYKSPTICEVVNGNKYVKTGDVLLVHHNLLYLPSPFHLQDDMYSIPFSKVLFARIDTDGNLEPICGNLLCSEVEIESLLPQPPDQIQVYKNRYVVTNPGWTEYKIGDIIFTRPSSGYQIVYHWNDEQRIAVKVDATMICGVLNKKT